MNQADMDEVVESGERLPLAMFESGMLTGDTVPTKVLFDGEKLIIVDEE